MHQQDSHEWLFTALLPNLMAIVLAAAFWLARSSYGHAVDETAILKTTALALFGINAAQLVGMYVGRWQSAATLLLSFTGLALAGALIGTLPTAIFIVAALVTAIPVYANILRHIAAHKIALSALGAVGFSLGLIGFVWDSGTIHPYFDEILSIGALGNIDTIFHMAIGSMIKTHTTSSFGFDGVFAINYHVGSHWLFAHLSSLLGISIMEFYQLAYPVIFVPLLFQSLFITGFQLRDSLFEDAAPYWGQLWLALFVMVIGVLPFGWQATLDIARSFASSESYNLSLTLLFLFTTILLAKLRPNFARGWYVVIAAMLVILGAIKVSTMLMAYGAIGYIFLRYSFTTRREQILSLVAYTGVVLLVSRFVSDGTHFLGFTPFAILQDFNPIQVLAWLVFYFFGVWWVLAIAAYLHNQHPKSITPPRRIAVELLLMVALAGAIPGLAIDVLGGSDAFFSDLQRWMALALLIGSAGLWRTLFSHPQGRYIMAAFSLGVLVVISFNILRPLDNYTEQLQAQTDLINTTETTRTAELLHELAELPRDEKANALLYIPQSNITYWELLGCFRMPYIAPGVTGIAMLDGMAPLGCEGIYAGFNYDERERTAPQPERSIEELCALPPMQDFDELIILEADQWQRHDCN